MKEMRGTRIIRCPACQRYYRLAGPAPAGGTRLRCTKCGEVFGLETEGRSAAAPPEPAASPEPPGQGRVLVATDGEEFQSLIGEVLTREGWHLRLARSGEDAWRSIEAWQPQVALLDVALPGRPAFELCDLVRTHPELSATGLILIASVFQHTRYKRAPTSLYGADDYIEKHHIRDWLPEKVSRLMERAPAPPPPPRTNPEARLAEREKESLIREECPVPQGRPREGTERLRENLRRYARIIVSDIALYNQDLVERGIREGTFMELLENEIEEGRRLYLTRVPPSEKGEDHFLEAVRNFVAKRSAAPGGGHAPRGKAGHGRH